MAKSVIHIADPTMVRRVNAEIRRSGSRMLTKQMAATLIDEALAARQAMAGLGVGSAPAAAIGVGLGVDDSEGRAAK